MRRTRHRWIAVVYLQALFVLAIAAAAAASTEVYVYRDARGVDHFTRAPLPGARLFAILPDARSDRSANTMRFESEYDDIIHECAAEYAVEPALVKAMIRAESSFDAEAVSSKGAHGLMQLMPATARSHGVSNLHDPRENIRAGVRHLRTLLDRFRNDATLAVAAYNAGTDVVARYRPLPPYRETRTYVAKVLRFRRQYLGWQKTCPVRSTRATGA